MYSRIWLTLPATSSHWLLTLSLSSAKIPRSPSAGLRTSHLSPILALHSSRCRIQQQFLLNFIELVVANSLTYRNLSVKPFCSQGRGVIFSLGIVCKLMCALVCFAHETWQIQNKMFPCMYELYNTRNFEFKPISASLGSLGQISPRALTLY